VNVSDAGGAAGEPQVLAADFGGTRSRVAQLAVTASGTLRPVRVETYAARELAGAGDALARFLAGVPSGGSAPAVACLGVAGAVQGNRAWMTNLDWEVDGAQLGCRFGLRVELLNDLVATALGLPLLAPGDLLDLNPGIAASAGHAVLLGAGTGLGMALLVTTAAGVLPVPSEGGHVEFAPRDEEQWRLRAFLAERLGGRVSAERVVSGSGLRNLYDFLLADGVEPSPAAVRRLAAGEDAGAVIGELGLAGSCEACVRALDLFASCYGSLAGDMALMMVARGGVLLGGGVSVRLAEKLADGTFRRAFLDKGRLSYFVEKVPLRVILRSDTALLGAARHAADLAAAGR
jgi:glucokinase